MKINGLLCGMALAASACAMNPPPVPVAGAVVDVRALAGEWFGEYRSVETGRSGGIYFKLEAGRDTAVGDVMMSTPRQFAPNEPMTALPPDWGKGSQVLTIRFVRVSGNTLSGRILPYPSPECECQLLTEFQGRLIGNRIEGTYTTRHSEHAGTQNGSWYATRK